MVGKNPHRPEGKAKADNEHMQAAATSKGMPYQSPSQKEVEETNLDEMERRGGQSSGAAEQQIGGSRPGVPSRVQDAIDAREERESE